MRTGDTFVEVFPRAADLEGVTREEHLPGEAFVGLQEASVFLRNKHSEVSVVVKVIYTF